MERLGSNPQVEPTSAWFYLYEVLKQSPGDVTSRLADMLYLFLRIMSFIKFNLALGQK